jgi:hypothetical protein
MSSAASSRRSSARSPVWAAIGLTALILIPRATAALATEDTPEAVLMSLSGAVFVDGADGSSRTGSFGMHLQAGDTIRTGPQASAEILFAAGNWIQVGPGSSLAIQGPRRPASKADTQGGGESFGSVQRFLKLRESRGTSSLATLRSGGDRDDLVLLSPCQTRIRDSRPRFRWRAADPAQALKLTVYSNDGVLWDTPVEQATELRYPADAPALQPGVSYSWTVETTDPLLFPPRRSQAGFFEILPPDETTQVEQLVDSLQAKDDVSALGRHLLLASAYYDHGLVEDAASQTQEAVDLDPENPQLRSILARLYAELGRAADALNVYEQLVTPR